MYMQKAGMLMWFIEWKNSWFAIYFSCSLDTVLVKMGEFYKHSLLVECIGLDPTQSHIELEKFLTVDDGTAGSCGGIALVVVVDIVVMVDVAV